MDLRDLATRLAFPSKVARKKQDGGKRKRVSKPKADFVAPKTEYSAHIDLSITVDFEGDIAKDILEKKIQHELIAAIESGMATVAEEFDLQSTVARVKPIKMELAINDEASIEDDMDQIPA